MRKKLTAILLAVILTISILPMSAMAVVPDSEKDQIESIATKLVLDYAKKVYRPNSDDDAFDLYFKHGFYGNGKDLILTEDSPMVSTLLNACLMQDTLINGITKSITTMQNTNLTYFIARGGASWHDYNYASWYHGYSGGEIREYEKFVNTIHNVESYTGPRNENDSVLELIGGGVNAQLTLTELERKESSAVYDLNILFKDRFDFTSDYSKVAEKGYDASKDQDLVNLGYLMTFIGLDEFDWSYSVSFQLEVPFHHHTHGTHNYHFTYDGATISLQSENGNGFTANPSTQRSRQYKASDGTMKDLYYHELRDAIVLKHDRPWVMEWDQKTLNTLQFSAVQNGSSFVYPTIFASGRDYVWLYLYRWHLLEDGVTTTLTHHYLGVETKDKFEYDPKHTYTHTLENVVNEDGTNMVYLSIYDHDLAQTVLAPEPMDDHWTRDYRETERTKVSDASDYAMGHDIIINYAGNVNSGMGGAYRVLDFRVWENGKDAEPDAGTYTAPTCTDQGGYLHNCHKCGNDYLTQAEAALGHDFGDYTDDNNTTCTEDGTKTRTCSRCGLKDTVVLTGSAYGHDYSDYTDDGNTTCTVDGTEIRTCNTCGNTETRTMEGSAQGHQFGAYKFDHNSSCTADGTMTAVCSVCGEKDVITAEGSATGHNHKATVTAPTCTEQGYTTYTCHCGDTYVDDYTEPTPHKEIVLPAIPSTCVEKGKTEGKQCELCGEITVPQTPTAYGNHTWDAGTVIKEPTLTEPGTLMYTCVNCSKTSHMSITEMPSTGFDDVPADAYYAAAVAWAKANGITSGLSETIFGSDMSCTRGQVVTFLWAAAGRPEPKTSDNPFTDVSDSDYFYKPVLWAVENGITGGIGDGLFGPNETCTRGQIVTFLWASQGKPQSGSSTFTDVLDTDWYAKSVVWAAENGVTGGIGNNMFGPNNTCTRAQVVTFLYKVYG